MSPLDTARGHMDALRRRTPIPGVHTTLLLGQIIDILAAQQAEIEVLRAQLDVRQRDAGALGAKLPAPAPYTHHLPWLGAAAEEAAGA